MDGSESGQHHLERLLAQAANIPAELRPYYLVATGTKWRGPYGGVCVPCLLLFDHVWVLSFIYVDGVSWDGRFRVVRVCK